MNFRVCPFLIALLALLSTAHAQPWPNKPIKLIVPFPAGGPTDLVGREAANILRGALGQAVIVENRPGGNGTVPHLGAEMLQKATNFKLLHVPFKGAAQLPAAIVKRLHEALVKGMHSKEVLDRFAALGASVHTNASPEEFVAYIKAEHTKWGAVIRAANIKVE